VRADSKFQADEVDYDQVRTALNEMQSHAERFTAYVDYVFSRSDKSKLDELANLRRFSTNILAEQQVFYVPKSAASLIVPRFQEDLRSFGVISERSKPVFYDRWLFPIRDTHGYVVNLVGYSPTAHERYLFGKTPYYDRGNTLYGLENLSLVAEGGYALITEGITDAVRLRDIGYKAAFAMCGTGSSAYIYGQVNRRALRCVICFPDRDEPGKKALRRWAFNNRYVVWADPGYKDIDEMCRKHPYGVKAIRKVLDKLIGSLETGVLSGDAVTVRVPSIDTIDNADSDYRHM